MKNLSFIGLMTILMVSCIGKPNKNLSTNLNDTITFKAQLTDAQNSIPYYQCEDYAAFTIEPSTRSVDSLFHGFFACSKETVVNTHDSSEIDTIYSYSNKANKIKIYKSVSKDLLTLYDVKDSIFELNGQIKPGISKDYFSKKFSIEGLTKDTVDIGNMEHTAVIRFYFEDNKLRRIVTEPYID